MNKISFLKKIGCYPTNKHIHDLGYEKVDAKFKRKYINPVFRAICSMILFCIVIVICGVSILSDLLGWVSDTSMFQRSGALIVASALFVEFAVHTCDDKFSAMSEDYIWADDVDRLAYIYKMSMPVGVGAVLIGTLIWAYGDFLISADEVCHC